MKYVIRFVAALTLLLGGVAHAKAGILEFASADTATGTFSLGYKFQTNTAITVTQLGMFDDISLGGPGWSAPSHDVAIYTENGALVVQGSVLGTDTLVGHFRYHDIAPTLLAGNATYFVVGATRGDGFAFNATGRVNDPRITFLGGAYTPNPLVPDAALFPVFEDGSEGYFGGTFGAEVAAVPEPATLTMLGFGIAGLAGYGWRKRRQAVTAQSVIGPSSVGGSASIPAETPIP